MVFRSTVTAPDDASFQFQAVCKMGYGPAIERVKREAGLYQQQLKALQGRYIPRVFGFFVGTTSRGPTAALVMSYEGRQLKRPMGCLPLQFRCVCPSRRESYDGSSSSTIVPGNACSVDCAAYIRQGYSTATYARLM